MPAGPSRLIEPAGEMWSVVTLSPSSASTRAPRTSSTRRRLRGHALEVGRQAHVGRALLPGEALAGGDVERVPALVAVEHLAVALAEHVRLDGLARSSRRSRARRARCPSDRRLCPARPAPAGRRGCRCPSCRPARRPRTAAARRGSSSSRPDGCGPRSCGCPTAPRRPPGRRRDRLEISGASGPELPMQVVQP